jgi:hypothetical protein
LPRSLGPNLLGQEFLTEALNNPSIRRQGDVEDLILALFLSCLTRKIFEMGF